MPATMKIRAGQCTWLDLRTGLLVFTLLAATVQGAQAACEAVARQPQIAIIVDDLGYRHAEGLRALALPGKISYSILPHSPHGEAFAKRAHADRREVLLHLPMQSVTDDNLGPGGLTRTMTATEVRQTLRDGLGTVPGALGVSNHMGSDLTAQLAAMTTVMFFIHKHQLFFVDSLTTSNSVAYETARRLGIPSIERDVFLDHDSRPEQIQAQFDRLVALAFRHGTALGVAHPYPSTMDVLTELLGDIEERGVEIVFVSTLIRSRECTVLTANASQPLAAAQGE